MANIKSGRWKTAFTHNPDQEIWKTQMDLKRQAAQTLEKMEAQINKIERELGQVPTTYICRA
jgi:hypothetical protein